MGTSNNGTGVINLSDPISGEAVTVLSSVPTTFLDSTNNALVTASAGYAYNGTLFVPLESDANGNLNVNISAGSVTVSTTKQETYSAAIVGLNAANNATDIFTITGSASKTIKIHHIIIGGTRTSTNLTDLVFLKRSTANSGGTSTTLTNVPHDSTDVAATATVLAYTANPTLGTLVGNLAALKAPFTAVATALDVTTEIEYGFNDRRPIVLRGVGQVFAINLGSTTIAGNNINITIEWTEE